MSQLKRSNDTLKFRTNQGESATERADGGALRSDQLRMERRRFPRHLVEANVTAVFSDEHGRVGVTPLELRDASATGMGGISATALREGMKIMICPAGVAVASRCATVVHCQPCPDNLPGFEVGLRFENRRAA
ncbi:MAG: PilZ domain-containing protein [Phycisphaerales bacterium]|nr:PilZ domain-containing protein [Phycisphaerales bacterium]